MRRFALLALLLANLIMLSALGGCGGGGSKGGGISSKQKRPAVSVAPTSVSLAAGGTQQFAAAVTGTTGPTTVTWSTSGCTGSACGTIGTDGLYTAPAQIPNAASVTIVATLQSDASVAGSATVNLAPVKVDIPEASINTTAGLTHQFTANVTGTSNTAVIWSFSGCSGAACGTVSATGLYTAPSVVPTAGAITIVATSSADSSKSDSATVNLAPLTIQLTEKSVSLNPGDSHQFVANVVGNPNTAVTWSVSNCGASDCGSLDASGMYTAPASVASALVVTIKATSQADATKNDTATVNVAASPVSVAISPASGVNVSTGSTQVFTAIVAHDFNSLGVSWSLDAACTVASCGSLGDVTTASVTYNAPATVPNPATVKLTATSIADHSKIAQVVITITAAPLLKAGDYAFLFNAWVFQWSQQQDWFFNWYWTCSVQAQRSVGGHFHADANGNISNGVEDINDSGGVHQSVPFTGTYTIGSDRQGSFTIVNSFGTEQYQMTIDPSGTKASFIRYDANAGTTAVLGSGWFELQDSNAFSQAALTGEFALGVSGYVQESNRLAAVGRFSADPNGALMNGLADAADANSAYQNIVVTGAMTAPDAATGRGTATINLAPAPGTITGTLNFVYYVVSRDRIALLQSDARGATVPVLNGEVRRQTQAYTLALFNAPVVFQMAGSNSGNTLAGSLGQIVPDGGGFLTGTLDQNLESALTLNQSLTGTYTMNSGGRSAMTLQAGSVISDAVAYLFGQNEGFLLQTTGAEVLFGSFKPQAGGPFSNASIAATYRIATDVPIRGSTENDSGKVTFDGNGGLTQTLNFNLFDGSTIPAWQTQRSYSGNYSVAANGRGDLNITSPFNAPIVFWVISPNEMVGLATVSPGDSLPDLSEYLK